MTPVEKLKALDALNKQREELNLIENFLNSDNGKNAKWFKAKLNAMMNDVRHLYVDIRADAPTADKQLLALQVEEKTLAKVSDIFADVQVRKNELDKQIEMVSNAPESEDYLEPLTRRPE
jgi:hypothetical protein